MKSRCLFPGNSLFALLWNWGAFALFYVFLGAISPSGISRLCAQDVTSDAQPLISVFSLEKSQKIEIDGLLGEAEWSAASGFSLVPNRHDKTISDACNISMVHDENFIYIAARCGQRLFDPALNQLDRVGAKVVNRDGPVYGDDSVEVFLAPPGPHVYHYVVNSSGVIYDARDREVNWNSSVIAGVHRNGHGWTLEMKIPIREICSSWPADSKWKMNVFRNNPAIEESAAWSPTNGDFHAQEKRGDLVLLDDDSGRCFVRSEILSAGTDDSPVRLSYGSAVSVLGVQGGDFKSNGRGSREVKVRGDESGYGRFAVSNGDGKIIYRSPFSRVSIHSSPVKINIRGNGKFSLYVNGEKRSVVMGGLSEEVLAREDKTVLAISHDGSGRVDGCVEVNGVGVGISEFLCSRTPVMGWEQRDYNDSEWGSFGGGDVGSVYLRYSIVRNHSKFAPQLDNGVYYVANKTTNKVTVRLSSPFEWAVKEGRVNVVLPDGMSVAVYDPSGRRYNRYKNSLSTQDDKRGRLHSFKFDGAIPRLSYNFGYNVVSAMVKSDFGKSQEGQKIDGLLWFSGRGFVEIPNRFAIAVLPCPDGRQPKSIAVLGSAEARDVCYSTDEIGGMAETWKACGYNMMWTGVQNKKRLPDAYDRLDRFARGLRGEGILCLRQSFAHEDTYEFSDIYESIAESRVRPYDEAEYKKQWRKVMCPHYFVNSEEVASRLAEGGDFTDGTIVDLEWSVAKSCVCQDCLRNFAEVNEMAVAPTEADVRGRLSGSWQSYIARLNYKIAEFVFASAHKNAKSKKIKAVYSGNSSQPVWRYGMDWKLFAGKVDWAFAGYEESDKIVTDTYNSIGGSRLGVGLYLDSNYGENVYPGQGVSLRLWRQLLRSRLNGVVICTWEEMDGRGIRSLSDFTRGVSNFESLLKMDFMSRDLSGVIRGGGNGLDYLFCDGNDFLYVLINPSDVSRRIFVKFPLGGKAPERLSDFIDGRSCLPAQGEGWYGVEVPGRSVSLVSDVRRP